MLDLSFAFMSLVQPPHTCNDHLKPIRNAEVSQFSEVSLHVLSGFDPLFPFYDSCWIIFIPLHIETHTYQLMCDCERSINKGKYLSDSTKRLCSHRVNYFEGVPIISYNKQVTLSISVSSPWSCHLQKINYSYYTCQITDN